jgi:uncharacterized protein
MRLAIVITVALLAAVPMKARAASLDCANASRSVDKLICSSPPLSELDSKLGEAYRVAVTGSADPESVRKTQRDWLRNTRDKCQDDKCRTAVYVERISELGGSNSDACSAARRSAYAHLAAAEMGALIHRELSGANLKCAVEAARALAQSSDAISGEEGIEARYSLRELAVAVAGETNWPVSLRSEILNASAVSALPGSNSAGRTDDIKADVAMLMAGANAFRKERGYVAEFDAHSLAIRLHLKLPPSDRYLAGWNFDFATRPLIDERLLQLLSLIDEVRADPVLNNLRTTVARNLYFSGYVYDPGDSAAANAARAAGTLALTEKLRDCPKPQDVNSIWYWHPILRAGIAYQLIGQVDAGRANIERALQIIHDARDPNERLAEYRFALVELMTMSRERKGNVIRPVHYDKSRMLALIDEMSVLADSLDTPIAKEQRGTIRMMRTRLESETD